MTPEQELLFVAEISGLRMEVQSADPLSVIRDGSAAAVRFGLTAYDAAYVDLAWREGLQLATLDKAMRRARCRSQSI